MNKVVNRSDRARPESEETEVTPQSSADPIMAGSEAGNSNISSAQEEATKVTSKLLSLAVKKVTEHNKNLRPFADLGKTKRKS